MNLGEKINYYRKKKGLMQAELGAQLFVTRQTVSLWENGQTLPSLDNIVRLAEIFGITIDELLSKKPPADFDAKSESVSEEKIPEIENTALSETESESVEPKKRNKYLQFFTKRPVVIIASLVGAVLIFCALFFALASRTEEVSDGEIEAVIGTKLPEYKSRSMAANVQDTARAKIISITEISFENDVISELNAVMDDKAFSGISDIISSAFIYKDCELYALYSSDAERRVKKITDSGTYLFACYDSEMKILRVTKFEYK